METLFNWLDRHVNLSFLSTFCLWSPAEASPPGADAAPVPAGLRRSQRVRVLQPAVAALLPSLRAAVPLRRPGGTPGRRRRRRHPHPGEARRSGRGAAAAEPPAAAAPRLQEPGGGDPHHGQEDGRAAPGLEETEQHLHYDAAAQSKLMTCVRRDSVGLKLTASVSLNKMYIHHCLFIDLCIYFTYIGAHVCSSFLSCAFLGALRQY